MAGFNEAYSKMQQQRDELLAACKALLPWAIRDDSRIYDDPIPDECMSNELKAVVDQVRTAIANTTSDQQPLTQADMIQETNLRR